MEYSLWMNYLMETLDVWTNVHPSLVTRPMEWNYEMPYGIIYAKKPSESVKRFINVIQAAFNKYSHGD